MNTETHTWDFLSEREARFVDTIMSNLADAVWARPILAEIERNGGLTRANKSRFFELRFGYALHRAGIVPCYEVPGEGGSTLDFGFMHRGTDWRVELMRLEETQAVQDATQTHSDEDGIPWASLSLCTNTDNPTHSNEGETLKAVQRICQKCERNGQPYKFPALNGAYHVILVDFRTFMNGGDIDDRIHVGLGGEYVQNEVCRMWWEGQLISGVFNERTRVRGAKAARERVHYLGFVHETEFVDGGFAAGTQFIANPYLFASEEDVQRGIDGWPLESARVINSR